MSAKQYSHFYFMRPGKSKATFTLLRFRFYPFLLMKTLLVHIASFSNEYDMIR